MTTKTKIPSGIKGGAVYDYSNCINKINLLTKKSCEMWVEVGAILRKAKTFAKMTGQLNQYNDMFKELRFSKGTGDKLIQISKDKYLKKYIGKNIVPASWDTMYKLINLNDEQWRALEKKGLDFNCTGAEVSELLADTPTKFDLWLGKFSAGKLGTKSKKGADGKTDAERKISVKKKEQKKKDDQEKSSEKYKKVKKVEGTDYIIDAFGNYRYYSDMVTFNNSKTDKLDGITIEYDSKSMTNDEIQAINATIFEIYCDAKRTLEDRKLDGIVNLKSTEQSLNDLGIELEVATSEVKKAS